MDSISNQDANEDAKALVTDISVGHVVEAQVPGKSGLHKCTVKNITDIKGFIRWKLEHDGKAFPFLPSITELNFFPAAENIPQVEPETSSAQIDDVEFEEVKLKTERDFPIKPNEINQVT